MDVVKGVLKGVIIVWIAVALLYGMYNTVMYLKNVFDPISKNIMAAASITLFGAWFGFVIAIVDQEYK